MHPVFSIAVFDGPTHRAFGIDLQPLTLGHLFLLREYRSNLLLRARASTLGDVLMAAFICSSSHQEARENLREGKRLDRFLHQWGKIARKGRFDLIAEVRKFYAYWNECFECPCVEPIGPAGKAGQPGPKPLALQSPEEWRTLAMLMADLHMTRERAMETEIAWSTAMWAANGERLSRHSILAHGMDSGTEAAWKAQHAIDLTNKLSKEAPCPSV